MNYQFIRKTLLFVVFFAFSANLQAQQTGTESKYDPHLAFSPLFYTQNGNEFRSASGYPGAKYWQNRADYNISATLDDQNNTVTGTVTITYKNNSPDQLPYIWLQLDQNLFAENSRGNGLIKAGSRYGARGEKVNGGYKITDLAVSQKTQAVKFTSVIEDTRMQIRLDKPLAANGELITIKMNYSFVIPINGSDRMGHLATKNGEIYSIAQWFPRLCVYDDVLGWNTLPYWGAGEFYCEYGDVNYSVTAPASHILMGSGELLNAEEVFTPAQLKRWNAAKSSDQTIAIRTAEEVTDPKSRPAKDKLTWKYKMSNTRDVAFASSKAFVLDAARINLPSGKKSLAVSAQPVESNGREGYGRGVEYVKSSIEHYSEKWFEYPYPMAVNIASNISGMEYPGLVFCGWKAQNEQAWGVIDHEFGHSWFPMIVGSNERKFGWMDEGFNTFINSISSEAFNKGEYKSAKTDMHATASYMAKPEREMILVSPDAMVEANIGTNLYYKPAIGLKLLREQILGHDRFDYAFRNYIKHWAFKHPTPFDFFRSMENGAGEDLSWFWKGWFLQNWKMDQAITSVTPVKKDGQLESYNIVISNLEQMPMPIILQVKSKSGKVGNIKIPVDVWMSNKSWTINYPTTEELLSAELDPEKILPDVNVTNNTWFK
ncbi:M1 family metallopeptidase [Pedobacter lusitanus]|uniref:M1 family metallopeptidase n=1 Tax=Pedobacter lusitanus TaxID=1503925 RepID=UPI000A853C0D|nr:M1 family metallopeptidase [Pedobacter lusitanus]